MRWWPGFAPVCDGLCPSFAYTLGWFLSVFAFLRVIDLFTAQSSSRVADLEIEIPTE